MQQVGDVKIAEASVLVQVISGHRKESFEATAEIMNKLKSKVIQVFISWLIIRVFGFVF
jgi:molybdopterin synthase catalytic subunit